jgi:hypothetical protein
MKSSFLLCFAVVAHGVLPHVGAQALGSVSCDDSILYLCYSHMTPLTHSLGGSSIVLLLSTTAPWWHDHRLCAPIP